MNEKPRNRTKQPREKTPKRRDKHRNTAAVKAPINDSVRRELKYHGWHAGMAIWRQRPQDIIRIYVTEERVPDVTKLLAWAAKNKLAYHIISEPELVKVAESQHHQGLCLLARAPTEVDSNQFVAELAATKHPVFGCYLDRLGNPHNVGAILRSLAFFGAPFVLSGSRNPINLSPSACRVAEGGAEFVNLITLENPLRQLSKLKECGFTLAASVVEGGLPLYDIKMPARTILILGNEETGVETSLAKIADIKVTIPGAKNVESLNVSAAAAVFAAHYFGQHHKTE